MRRHAVIGLAAAASLVLAIPAGSGVQAASVNTDHVPPNLAAALEEIAFAIDHEESAGDALDEAGARADDYAAGEIDDAIGHLNQALNDLAAAVSAGEISAAEASAIGRLIREARGHDGSALNTIDGAAPSGTHSTTSVMRSMTR